MIIHDMTFSMFLWDLMSGSYVLLQFDTCSRAVLQMLPILFHKRVILCPPFSLTCSTMFMLFLRFCSYFLLVVLWLSQFFHVYPMIFMFCSMVFLWCSCVFPWFLLRFPTFFLRFSYVFPVTSQGNFPSGSFGGRGAGPGNHRHGDDGGEPLGI